MKFFKILFCLAGLISLPSSAMELPLEQRGVKRDAPEVAPSHEELETQEKKGRTLTTQEKVQALQEQAAFSKLPQEVLKIILGYLETAQGFGAAKLYNAASNIRNYLLSMKSLWPYLSDVNFTRTLIRELARRYAGGDHYTGDEEVEAAIALGTKGASNWLREQLRQNKMRDGNVNWLSKKIVLRAIEAMNRKQHDLARFLLQSATSLTPNESLIPVNFLDIPYRMTLLKAATGSGNTENLTKVLNLHPDVNFDRKSGNYPILFYAIDQGNIHNVYSLLNAGAERIWYDKNNNPLHTALIAAVDRENLTLVRLFLRFPDIVTSINVRDHVENETALDSAIHKNNIPIIEELLKVPGIVKDGNPVHRATLWKYKDILKLLLQAGANPNIPDNDGELPLFSALDERIPDTDAAAMAAMLLKSGAEINQRSGEHHETPLMVAAQKGKIKTIEMLLEYRADPELQDDNGHTALWHAEQSESPNKETIIRVLKKYSSKF